MTISEKQMEYEKVPTKELIHEGENEEVPASFGYGIRHVQTLILFLCMLIGYVARAHLGVTIVAMSKDQEKSVGNISHVEDMVNRTDIFNGTDVFIWTTNVNITDMFNETETLLGELNITSVIGETDEENDSIWNVYRTYDWPKSIQEIILDAFFFGYCLMMFPMGLICQRFGGKLPLQFCLLINGLVSLATPTVAVWGDWKAVCGCRVLQGMSQAGLFPSAHNLLSKWVSISERASLASYVYTGTLLGTVVAFQIGGLLADSAAGWPGIFWLTGVLCIGSFAVLTVFGAASPADHKTVSDKEKNFILGRIDDGKQKVAKAPWKHILKSKHVWATFVTHISAGIYFVFLFTQIPTYMHYILGFDVKNSGLLSSLPYIASALANMGFGVLSDFCTNRGYVTLKNARRVSNTIAQAGSAVCLVSVTLTDNSTVAVILLIAALALFAGIHSGWMVNYIDLAPNYGGSLMAMGNTWSTLGILTQPFLVSNIVTDVTNRYQWRILMFVISGLIFFCNAYFVCFMSADVQPWNDIQEEEEIETEMTEKKQ